MVVSWKVGRKTLDITAGTAARPTEKNLIPAVAAAVSARLPTMPFRVALGNLISHVRGLDR
jgi:hypothetical protein